MSAFMPMLGDKRTSATLAIEPALRDLVHPRAHLVVLISEVARSFEPADDGPIARTDLAAVALAIAVDEGYADPALPIDDLGRDRLERPMMTHPGIAPL